MDKVLRQLIPKLMEDAMFPANDWRDYVEDMLDGFIHNITTATYNSAPRVGLANVTLMQCMSLPPDAWIDSAPSVEKHPEHSGSAIQLKPPKGYDPMHFALPICHVSPWLGSDHSSFTYNGLVFGTMSVGQSGGQSLSLPSDPTIGTISAASSAALGFLSSPMMSYQALSTYDAFPIQKVKGDMIDRVAIKAENGVAEVADVLIHDIGEDLDKCLPEGLESTGVGTSRDGGNVTRWPNFRFIDGAYTENTGAAFALGEMQAECKQSPPALDCSQGLKLIILSHNVPKDKQGSMRLLFKETGCPPGARLAHASTCTDCGWTAPMPSIFNATYSSLDWKPYSTFTNSDTSATYFVGTLTTMSNDFYNVRGGEKVHVALFNLNIDAPIVLPGSAELDKIYSDGVSHASKSFSEVYAPMAEGQAKDVAPILQKFVTPNSA